MSNRPILYSFRRCPYAMRARLAMQVSGQETELREVILRDKPAEMIEASPKATVPVLIEQDGSVIDESFDIMNWALARNDPEEWLTPEQGTLDEMNALIAEFDGPFKSHLDKYKYSSRYAEPGNDAESIVTENRSAAMTYLGRLNHILSNQNYLFGSRFSLADAAIAPFVRQFANTDADWFAEQDIPYAQDWLHRFVTSSRFTSIMTKYPQWKNTETGVPFPQSGA